MLSTYFMYNMCMYVCICIVITHFIELHSNISSCSDKLINNQNGDCRKCHLHIYLPWKVSQKKKNWKWDFTRLKAVQANSKKIIIVSIMYEHRNWDVGSQKRKKKKKKEKKKKGCEN